MELNELNLTDEQMKGVQEYLQVNLQSEGDKITKNYDTQIEGLNKTIKDLQAKLPVEKTPEQLAYEKEYEDFRKEKALFELEKALANKGLNSELKKYINVEGVEDLETYLDGLAEIIGKNKNTFRPNKNTNPSTNIKKEDFKKMNTVERMKLYNENKELYDMLTK